MEDKDYATPLDGEKKQNDTGESPDLASYYASAASAAATGHEFRPDEPEKDKTDEAIAAADDASATDDAASETSADADAGAEGSPVADSEAPENDAQNAGTDANEPSDISGDGSPHGPLDLFSESPEDKKKWIVDEEAAAVVQKFVAYANERYLVIQTKYRSLCFLLTSTARCHNH